MMHHTERPTRSDRLPGEMMAEHQDMAAWTYLPMALLGAWLAGSPLAMAYERPVLVASDVVSGLAVAALAWAGFARRRAWIPWAICVIGLWVMAAPLFFWAPSAAVYNNGSLVGAMLVGFSVLIPMRMAMPGPDVPAGWSYNPSTWQQRMPILVLGFASYLLARNMAAFQLGHIGSIGDPIFGDGTQRVLGSEVSMAFPISDAGLGAYVYLLEILSTVMGDERRWRTMPWMVAMFGLAVVPLGVISVILMTLQPVAVGAWCTPCLASAVLMLAMVALSLDEVVAMGQFLRQSVREGKPFWRTFFLGGEAGDSSGVDVARPSDSWRPRAMGWGVGLPLTLLAVTALGAWQMFAPAVTGAAGMAANNDHVVGALVITVTALAFAEVGRAARFLNVPIGLWLAIAPWLLDGATTASRWAGLVVGLLVVALSLPRGRVHERYGGWERFMR